MPKNSAIGKTISVLFLLLIMKRALCTETKSGEFRIYGGQRVKPGDYPSMVQIFNFRNGRHHCGGSLIKNRYVLTAAHCIKPDFTQKYKIMVGGIYRYGKDYGRESDRKQVIDIQTVKTHPHYSLATVENDIAILKLKQSAKMSSTVSIISMARRGRRQYGAKCTVMGWGDTPKSTDILLATQIEILEDSKCSQTFGNYQSKQMICAGDLTGRNDSCIGDSGGPLLCNSVLTGLVSFGKDCGNAGIGAVYTDVGYHERWIAKTLYELDSIPDMPTLFGFGSVQVWHKGWQMLLIFKFYYEWKGFML